MGCAQFLVSGFAPRGALVWAPPEIGSEKWLWGGEPVFGLHSRKLRGVTSLWGTAQQNGRGLTPAAAQTTRHVTLNKAWPKMQANTSDALIFLALLQTGGHVSVGTKSYQCWHVRPGKFCRGGANLAE